MEIVKYHNDINKIKFTGFNEKELNVFFSLIFLAKDKGTTELTIPFSDLKNLCNDLDRHKQRFIDILNNVNKKLIALHHQVKIENKTYTFSLFNVFCVDEKENILTVEVNKIFSYMLNDLIGNFTKFELENFISLKSNYSKNIFKILKQWENKKEKEFDLEEFKELLSVPKAYKLSDIDKNILAPIRKDLPKYFSNLKIEKIKTGRAVTSLKFTWGESKEKRVINYVDDEEIIISSELEKAFEKASRNRFIQPFLTSDNKVELIEFFEDEKVLIKGLIYAYKTINKDFKKLSYLIKTISTGAEKKNKVIVDTKELLKREKEKAKEVTIEDIENDNIRQTTLDEINVDELFNRQEEKIEVTQSEFDKLFNEYLIENKNNFGTNLDESEKEYIKSFFAKKYEIIEDKKVYTIDDIPAEKLLGKNGKKLTGGALQTRINKLLKEMNKN